MLNRNGNNGGFDDSNGFFCQFRCLAMKLSHILKKLEQMTFVQLQWSTRKSTIIDFQCLLTSQYHSRDLTVKWRKSASKRAQSPCNSTENHKNPRPQMPPTVENHAFISRRCTLSVDRIWPYADTRPTHSLSIRLTRLVSANHHEPPRTTTNNHGDASHGTVNAKL